MSGLYIHIPFCERKCIYCDFYSVETLESRERFLNALVREIELRSEQLAQQGVAPGPYETLFMGGGTPSLLTPDELERILTPLRKHFPLLPDAEITMECNPGAFARERIKGYRDLGINRLSFGVQSFYDDDLQFLSRIHSADEACRSIELAREFFDNVSLDLIFALPDQTIERWRENLRRGVELGTGHVSAYALIFEPGTPLNAMRLRGQVRPAPEGNEAEMYEETMRTLGAHGFEQYEVSNYTRPGRACRHNLGYWERRSYISFGPSAHSYRRDIEQRWGNVSSLAGYIGAIEEGRLPVAFTENLSPGMVLEEIVFLGLRSRGILLDDFADVAGIPFSEAAVGRLEPLVQGEYARFDEQRFSLTPKGYMLADHFALQIIDTVERRLSERHAVLNRPAASG